MIALLTRPFRLLALLVLLAAAGGAYWFWQGAHSSTAADRSDALTQFREGAAASAPVRAGAPAPGVYRYRVRGEESAGSGVLSVERPFPDEALYVITPTEDGYHEDLRFSQEHVEEARFRVEPRGTIAEWRRTKISFMGIGTDDRDDVVPPALDHPATMARGARWGGEYRLGDLAVSYRSRVVRTGTATVDGRTVRTVTFRTEASFTGATPGTRTDVVTWAPALSLPVAWSIEQATGGSSDFRMTADLELVSATPER